MFCLFLRPTPCHVHKRSPPRSIKLHGLEAKLAFAHALALPAPGAAVAWVKAGRIDDADDDDDNDDNDDDDDDGEDDEDSPDQLSQDQRCRKKRSRLNAYLKQVFGHNNGIWDY